MSLSPSPVGTAVPLPGTWRLVPGGPPGPDGAPLPAGRGPGPPPPRAPRPAPRGRRLVLLVAPAGYGKTTLLSEWAHRDERHFAWTSLTAEHAEADRLPDALEGQPE